MALETGSVNSYREALVKVRFDNAKTIECVVDTGFDGGLMLPRTFVEQIQLRLVGELTFEMVGGATMSAEVGLVEVDWLGDRHTVEVVISEGKDALLGTQLLDETILII